jgi:hypothetical protein
MKTKQLAVWSLGILLIGNSAMADLLCKSSATNPAFSLRTWHLIEGKEAWNKTYTVKAILSENDRDEEFNGTVKIGSTRLGQSLSYKLKDANGEAAQLFINGPWNMACKAPVGCERFKEWWGDFNYLDETHPVTCEKVNH